MILTVSALGVCCGLERQSIGAHIQDIGVLKELMEAVLGEVLNRTENSPHIGMGWFLKDTPF